MALNPNIVGMTYEYPDHYVIDREMVRRYALAVKNPDPAFYDDDAAAELGYESRPVPLTFVAIFGLQAQLAFFEHAGIPIEDEKIVQAEQGLTMLRPIFVGDELRCRIRLDSLRKAFGADVLTIRSTITNQHGAVVQEDYTVMAGRSEPEAGDPMV